MKTYRSVPCLVLIFMLIGAFSLAVAAPKEHLDSETVREAQEALKAQGFDPGPIDGLIGPQTRGALRLFQRENGIKDDGRLNDKTLEKLGLKSDERGIFSRIGSTVGDAASTAGSATARGATVAAKTTAKGAVTAGKATAKGATTAGKATAKGATTAGKATAKGGTTAGKATAKGGTTAGKATAKGTKAAASGVASAGSATKNFLTGGPKDEKLAEKVREALEKDPTVDASQIEVAADGRKVTLSFKSGSRSMRDQAVAVAKKVKGVDRVVLRP